MADSVKSDSDKVQHLRNLRHTTEHVLTYAMHTLFGTDQVIMAMGPATDEGFYFDFDSAAEFKVTEEDFPKIEAEMKKLVKANLRMQRVEIPVTTARQLFANNPYKQEWLDEIEAKGELVTVYLTGTKAKVADDMAKLEAGQTDIASFVDLCSGPHVESTGQIGAFKLLTIAGAYWRGDEKNKMLTRIYGTAFASKPELDEYLRLKEEALKRDHKILGPQLDLFTFSELVGSGLALWTPKGTQLRNALDEFVWKLRRERGYERVEIPHITKKDLYMRSGHWDKFKDELFKIITREGHEFAMKPMNCPHHTQIFARKPHSYREMPQRYANTTMVYRDEQSGELSGLSRVRSITQDDAHVFCRKTQVKEEIYKIWDIIDTFYAAVGFELQVRLSLSDPENPQNYLGSREDWQLAEQQLRELATQRGVSVTEAPGEAAFYGPKLDFMAHDSLGREWQVATIQLDMNMPERFDLYCINEKGEKERVVMLHAAIMGSIERYVSILIEHFGGAFPVWLAPVQIKILPIADRHLEYAQTVLTELTQAGLKVELDDRGERLPAKIRDAQLLKIPYMVVIGDKEVEENVVNVRLREGGRQVQLPVAELVAKLKQAVETKTEPTF